MNFRFSFSSTILQKQLFRFYVVSKVEIEYKNYIIITQGG